MYSVIGRAGQQGGKDISWPSSPIGTVSCTACVLCRGEGSAKRKRRRGGGGKSYNHHTDGGEKEEEEHIGNHEFESYTCLFAHASSACLSVNDIVIVGVIKFPMAKKRNIPESEVSDDKRDGVTKVKLPMTKTRILLAAAVHADACLNLWQATAMTRRRADQC